MFFEAQCRVRRELANAIREIAGLKMGRAGDRWIFVMHCFGANPPTFARYGVFFFFINQLRCSFVVPVRAGMHQFRNNNFNIV